MSQHVFPLPTPIELTAQKLCIAGLNAPQSVFTPLANKPWAMWLDSCESTHVDSRYDIIVWQPIATLTTINEATEIRMCEALTLGATLTGNLAENPSTESLKYVKTSGDDPLCLVKEIQNQLLSEQKPELLDEKKINDNLPFLGGALGYFSYDLGRRFEKLPKKSLKDINLPDMAIGIYSQAIIFDNQTQEFHLICQEEKRKNIEAWLTNLLAQETVPEPRFSLTTPWQANMDKASYYAKFEQVQNYLLSGDCYQINLAQRFSAQYQGDEFQAYLALRTANQAPFSAFIRLADSAILSISPERFLQCRQNKVQSKPIKGTIERSKDKRQDEENAKILAVSTKDRAENVMIVDLLRNDISKACIAGTVKVPKLFDIESFPAVHHLVSTVEGQLADNKDNTDLLRGAFPGGSITGAPKIRAMEIIEELEPHRRSVYCGSIGYISTCGTMDTSITIRTLVCEKSRDSNTSESMTNEAISNENLDNQDLNSKGKIHCWAGGGLVADSTAESEYQETFAKVNCILPVLSELNTKKNQE